MEEPCLQQQLSGLEELFKTLLPGLHLRTMLPDVPGPEPQHQEIGSSPRNFNVQHGWDHLLKYG